MGCDVHWHTEVKINGEWHHYDCPHVGRNYAMFELLVGVRGDPENALFDLKRIPDDASVITKIDYERQAGDAHNVSWINAEEIKLFEEMMGRDTETYGESYRMGFGYLFGNLYGDFATDKDHYPEEIEDVRAIFWFDN
jgi:hypothetical protein